MITRRNFLCGVSALAVLLPPLGRIKKAQAFFHGSAATSFNGGKTQFNTTGAQNSGDFTFINLIKGSQSWSYRSPPTDPTAPPTPISELDSDGYITSIVAGTTGVYTVFQMPVQSQYSGHWQLQWDGTGTVNFANTPITTVSGSSTSSPWVFYRTDDTGAPGLQITSTSAAPNNVRNIRLTKIGNDNTPYGFSHDDTTLLSMGYQFSPQHLTLIKSAKPGVIRSLGWGGGFSGTNNSFLATWASRKPRTYWSYGSVYSNAANYVGLTTNSGSDYTVSGSFSLTNKAAAHVVFNASAPAHRTIASINTTSGQPIQISWSSHGLAAGNTVVFGNSLPAPLVALTTYFVKTVVDADTFTLAATSGGTTINATNNATGVSFYAVSVPRININGTGFVPITGFSTLFDPANPFLGFSTDYPQAGVVSYLVYDSTIGYYYSSADGFIAGVPPEVFIDYCGAIGAHPHLVAPFLSVEPVSDFMTSWVTYAKNYPWMKPRVEPPNETWNTRSGFMGTQYGQSLAFALWGTTYDYDNAYGKWCSTLGQAISAIYGNDRTKYSMICSVWTTFFYASSSPGASVDARLKSTLYVSNNGGDPAYKWVDRVCGANYYNPAEEFTCQELIDAYAYSVTYSMNPTQQATIANNYVATANSGNVQITLDYVNQCFTNIKTWGLGMPAGSTIAGITCYEGGWSPDYLQSGWFTGITGASKASSCVLTLASTSGNSEGSGYTGNPAVVGMQVTPSSIVGMTQLNGNTYTITAVSGNLVTINVDSTGFGTYTSGGQVDYVNSQTYSNTLRGPASKASTELGTINALMYANFAALAQSGFVAEYPSNFLLTGNGNVWSVLDPDIYAPLTPQWNSIVAYNA